MWALLTDLLRLLRPVPRWGVASSGALRLGLDFNESIFCGLETELIKLRLAIPGQSEIREPNTRLEIKTGIAARIIKVSF